MNASVGLPSHDNIFGADLLSFRQLCLYLNFTEPAGCDGHGPCMHGTCELAQNGTYICICDEGWYGIECNVPGMILCVDFKTETVWYPLPHTVSFASRCAGSTSFFCSNASL